MGRLLRGGTCGQPPAGPAPAPPCGEPGKRPRALARRSPTAAAKWGPFPSSSSTAHYPESTSRLPPGWGSFALPPRLARRPATRAAGQMVAFIRSSPEDIIPLPPARTLSCPRQESCSSDKIEFHPMVCCSEIKLLLPLNHNRFSEMSS